MAEEHLIGQIEEVVSAEKDNITMATTPHDNSELTHSVHGFMYILSWGI